MDNYEYFRVWILFSSVVIHAYTSSVKVQRMYLNWTDSNEACTLIDFFSVKPNWKTLIADMNQNEKYWIKDTVLERSVVTKGCQTKVKILNSTTIEDNILSKCFQFCSSFSDTVGIKGNNCSCLSSLNNNFHDICDVQCVWTNTRCDELAAFSIYETKDYTARLGGNGLDSCILMYYSSPTSWNKANCSKKHHYICQSNMSLSVVHHQEWVTWLEAVSLCAKNKSVLATVLPGSSDTIPRTARRGTSYWVGLRQQYQTVSDDKPSCQFIERYNPIDIRYGEEKCEKTLKYICLNEITTSSSMVKPRDSTTKQEETPVQARRMTRTPNSETLIDRTGFHSSYIIGVVVGVLVTIAILLLAILCLFKRLRSRNSGSKYQSPTVIFSNAPRRDSKQSQGKSGKSTPLKPTRRSKKSNPNSVVEGVPYENIVLTFEDPSTISRVISSSSTKEEEKKDENAYDVMGASNANENTTNVSQNVYGFVSSENDYDVMNRGITRADEKNPLYDHM